MHVYAHNTNPSRRTIWNAATRFLVSLRVVSCGQLFGRMTRTSAEFDPTVVSAIQKLRCEHQTYPLTRGGSSPPSEGGACRLLVRLDDGNEPPRRYGN